MDESMNDFRELARLAMEAKAAGDEFPPPIERRVLTFGFLDRTVEVKEENRAWFAGSTVTRRFTVGGPVRRSNRILADGEAEPEKKGEVEKQENEKFGSHCKVSNETCLNLELRIFIDRKDHA
ncbi:hypothetical protein V6N12_047917 [Hibiscus sabdariffa]|uniref:Uncharacterized protein n=1 Tax=Hibiscus sabdariffa TaxID=183260 RepID=A0ABR2CUS5_9ROSI